MAALERSESVVVDVGAAALYALVSDVTRMGEWSPVCKSCWWDDDVDTSDGPVVGAWFTGRNETPDRTWDTRSRVVAVEPDREFAWSVNDGWVRWGFTLEPVSDEQTKLTESWVFTEQGIAGFHERWPEHAEEQIALRENAARQGIPVTLTAIKATAEGREPEDGAGPIFN